MCIYWFKPSSFNALRVDLVHIGGEFHDNFPGFLGFEFCRKLAITKTQQGTDKASKHNRSTLFTRDLVLLMRASTGVVSTLSIHLSYIFITLPHNLHQLPFLSLPPPPPPTEYAAPSDWTGLKFRTTASKPPPKPPLRLLPPLLLPPPLLKP